MISHGRVLVAALVAASVVTSGDLRAQPRRPLATVTPVVVTRDVAPGRDVQLELRVELPAKVHVQANKPRDPLFIPTVLTIEPPAGVTVEGVTYPASEELRQQGLAEPLLVFGSQFSVKVRVKLAGTVPAGDVAVPGRLRYQACDETTCYPPARAEAVWTLRVASAKREQPQ